MSDDNTIARVRGASVGLDYPIYEGAGRSLRHHLIEVGSGGLIKFQEKGITTITALDDISFDALPGDRIGLIGRNGAGKSTLLRVISKIYRPTKGAMEIIGTVTPLLSLSLGMEPDATGYENVRIAGTLMGRSRDEIEGCIPDIREFTELGDFLMLPIRTYSAGMQMRLAFAIATSLVSDILVIDEIISAGDAFFFKKAQSRIEHMVAQSHIMFMASHSEQTIRQFCNKAMLLEQGQLVAFGSIDDVLERYTQ
jgi:ABC-2 type transport system ATP-binding protein/lipopolysaccharide transport system ATP-binding protein